MLRLLVCQLRKRRQTLTQCKREFIFDCRSGVDAPLHVCVEADNCAREMKNQWTLLWGVALVNLGVLDLMPVVWVGRPQRSGSVQPRQLAKDSITFNYLRKGHTHEDIGAARRVRLQNRVRVSPGGSAGAPPSHPANAGSDTPNTPGEGVCWAASPRLRGGGVRGSETASERAQLRRSVQFVVHPTLAGETGGQLPAGTAQNPI